jgi:hypothetical protein
MRVVWIGAAAEDGDDQMGWPTRVLWIDAAAEHGGDPQVE